MSTDVRSLIAKTIDHSLLTATATVTQIAILCEEAVTFGFPAVCVTPRWIAIVADYLQETDVQICSVIDFPLGSESTEVKVFAAQRAIRAGADEIDMVADLAAIVEGDHRYLSAQFQAMMRVTRAMRPHVTLKVILETAALTEEQKIMACHLARDAGVDFVKTSTGFHPAGGATVEDVALLKCEATGCQVKASGGIKTVEQALAMLEAGATRLGTSNGATIITSLPVGAS